MPALRVSRCVSARVVAALLVAPILGATGVVRAEGPPQLPAPPAPGDDIINLKDGGVLRGTLIEVMPGDHASLQLATGQIAIVRWDAIARVERAQRPIAKAPPIAQPPPPPQASAMGQAFVHIDSEKSVAIERNVTGRVWAFACQAPCDMPLDLDKDYRIVGDGVRASGTFRLASPPGGRVNLEVNPASKGAFVGGIVIASLGLPILIVGMVLVATASDVKVTSGRDTSSTGWILTGLGAGGILGGILMLANNTRSAVSQTSGGAPAPRGASTERLPAWFDARATTPALPPTISILSGAF